MTDRKKKYFYKRIINIFKIYIFFILPTSLPSSKSFKFTKLTSYSDIILTVKGRNNQRILNNETFSIYHPQFDTKTDYKFEIKPSEIYINDIKADYTDFYVYDLEEETNEIRIRFNEKLKNCNVMFYGLENIIKIKFENFDSSEVTNIDFIFTECTNLVSLDLSNFDASSVTNMYKIFYYCKNLISLDLTNFKTSSTIYMNYMFCGCSSLTSLDLSSFNTSSVIDMESMFQTCSNLITLDLSNFNTTSVKKMTNIFQGCTNLISVDLSSFITSKVNNMNSLFRSCSNLISIDLSNFSTIQINNIYSILASCNNNLIYCINPSNSQTSNLLSHITSTNDYGFKNNNDCSHICFYKYKKIILETKKCVYNCTEPYIYEFKNICYKACPEGTYSDSKGNICIKDFYESSEINGISTNSFDISFSNSFYSDELLDRNVSITSITTSLNNLETQISDKSDIFSSYTYFNEITEGQNNENNNLKSTYIYNKENIYISDSQSNTEKVDTYNINNNTNNFYDIENDFSDNKDSNYSSDINDKINYTDSEYNKYNTDDLDYNNDNDTENILNKYYSDYTYNIFNIDKIGYSYNIYTDIDKSDIKGNKESINKTNYLISDKTVYNKDILISDNSENISDYLSILISKYHQYCDYSNMTFEGSFSSIDLYNYINHTINCYNENPFIFIRNQLIEGNLDIYILDLIEKKHRDLIFKQKNIIYTLTTTYNQKNIKYSDISTINLRECESKLKMHYNISNNTSLLIFKLEIYGERFLIPIIEYEVYDFKKKLDLNICKDMKIDIKIPVIIDENNLFKYNSSDSYYNDICHQHTTENNTDIIIKDRRNDYIDNNLALCENNCTYNEYDKNTKKVLCQCYVKIAFPLISEIKINKDKLLKNFIDLKQSTNINVIKCYKQLLNKNGIIANLGHYIISTIFVITFISSILFRIKGYSMIKNSINDIIENVEKENMKNDDNKNKNSETEKPKKYKKIKKKKK